MPERLDRVTVALKGGDFTFSGEARQALLARLYNADIKAGMMTGARAQTAPIGLLSAVASGPAWIRTRVQRGRTLRARYHGGMHETRASTGRGSLARPNE